MIPVSVDEAAFLVSIGAIPTLTLKSIPEFKEKLIELGLADINPSRIVAEFRVKKEITIYIVDPNASLRSVTYRTTGHAESTVIHQT